ncbi:hypothetical protein Pmani_000285 [Petrolisthes manimaculis]|uniref:Transient receptor potential cation channel subfamily M member 2 n=1 Tax=Petrolisthes manimaculis TaxID=1843537 RepID=A0AAE1QQ83_9EUCA|nr:hypothetical protein Pmani_000285 [Petrolisthes manimaculis]
MKTLWSKLPLMGLGRRKRDVSDSEGCDTWEYIKNFECKQCQRYVADPTITPEAEAIDNCFSAPCYCGLSKPAHPKKIQITSAWDSPAWESLLPNEIPVMVTPDPDITWSPEACIKNVRTDSYGVLLLKSALMGTNRPSEYVKLSSDTPMYTRYSSEASVLHLLTECWTMMEPKKPKLVISVMGGCRTFTADEAKRRIFMSGLIKVVRSTQAWLLTDGLNKGITMVVGEAVNQAQSVVKVGDDLLSEIKCLGVVPYGLIRGAESLLVEGDEERYNSVKYKVWVTELNGKVSLNGDHTHFLLVDDGFRNKKASADNFRTELEDAIQNSDDQGLGISVVVLMVGGDLSILNRCVMALERNIPVVVVKGTGLSADLISDTIELFMENDNQKLIEKVHQYYEEIDEQTQKDTLGLLKRCTEHVHHITVYDIDTDTDLDLAILKALLTGYGAKEKQLELTLQWNRADIAATQIFARTGIFDRDKLAELMTKALLDQKTDFVELLVGKGVTMKEYLTPHRLIYLYSHRADAYMKMLFKKAKNSQRYWYIFNVLKSFIETNERDTEYPSKVIEKKQMQDPTHITMRDIHHLFEMLIGKHMIETFIYPSENSFQDPYRELLLWAVISRRKCVAEYVWWKCKSPLSSAIVATCFSCSIINLLAVKDTRARMEQKVLKDKFESLAVKVVDECYQQDQTNALSLVQMKSPTWGDLTTLDLALLGSDIAFISNKCCQAIVDKCWLNLRWKFGLWLGYRAILLVLHTIMILFNLHNNISSFEILLAVMVLLDALQKGIEAITEQSFKLWKSAWNIYDSLTFTLFLIAFILRLSSASSLHISIFISRVMYAWCGVLFTCRLFRIYYIWARLGPMVIIFILMMYKLLEFLALFGLFILAYGVASMALTHHPCENREAFLSISTVSEFFEGLFFPSFWKLFGELQLGTLTGNETRCLLRTETYSFWPRCEPCVEGEINCDCTNNSDYTLSVKFMLAVYLIIGNVLLLNLLIAIFTNVFDSIRHTSIEHWNFEMYRLMRLYERKPTIPPPVAPFVSLFQCFFNVEQEKEPNDMVDDWNQTTVLLTLFEQQQIRSLQSKIVNYDKEPGIHTSLKVDRIYKIMSSWTGNDAKLLRELDTNFNGVKETVDMTITRVTELSRQLDLMHINLHEAQARLEKSQTTLETTILQLMVEIKNLGMKDSSKGLLQDDCNLTK